MHGSVVYVKNGTEPKDCAIHSILNQRKTGSISIGLTTALIDAAIPWRAHPSSSSFDPGTS